MGLIKRYRKNFTGQKSRNLVAYGESLIDGKYYKVYAKCNDCEKTDLYLASGITAGNVKCRHCNGSEVFESLKLTSIGLEPRQGVILDGLKKGTLTAVGGILVRGNAHRLQILTICSDCEAKRYYNARDFLNGKIECGKCHTGLSIGTEYNGLIVVKKAVNGVSKTCECICIYCDTVNEYFAGKVKRRVQHCISCNMRKEYVGVKSGKLTSTGVVFSDSGYTFVEAVCEKKTCKFVQSNRFQS